MPDIIEKAELLHDISQEDPADLLEVIKILVMLIEQSEFLSEEFYQALKKEVNRKYEGWKKFSNDVRFKG